MSEQAIELVSSEALATTDSGSWFVPDARLLEMDLVTVRAVEAAVQETLDANPDYQINVSEDPARQGMLIRWRRK